MRRGFCKGKPFPVPLQRRTATALPAKGNRAQRARLQPMAARLDAGDLLWDDAGMRQISYLSILALLVLTTSCRSQVRAQKGVAGWKERFTQMDANQDGMVTQEEAGLRPRMFKRLDADGDGKVTMAEAEAFATGRATAMEASEPDAQPATASMTDGEMKKTLNIPYASIPGVEANLLSLDIYAPKAAKESLPVVVMIHGGGWRTGDKSNKFTNGIKAPYFTSHGFVFVSINYRLSPAVKHPAHAEDVAGAVAWIMDHIAEYGGDPGRIYLVGHSAGAHLAALVATDESYLKKHGKTLSKLRGVVTLDTAAYDIPRSVKEFSGEKAEMMFENAFGPDQKVWHDASPMNYVAAGKGIPPFLAFYVDRDRSNALSKEFVSALRKAGVPAAAVHAKGKDHRAINQDLGTAGDGPTGLIMQFLEGKDLSSFPAEI